MSCCEVRCCVDVACDFSRVEMWEEEEDVVVVVVVMVMAVGVVVCVV